MMPNPRNLAALVQFPLVMGSEHLKDPLTRNDELTKTFFSPTRANREVQTVN